jgi:signal transduction histidine kinase
VLRSKTLRTVWISALAAGMPLLALFVLQWRFMGQLRASSTLVLRQASNDAADELAQRIRRDFGWPAFNLLERVNHAQVRALAFDGIARTITERVDHLQFVDRVFVWSKNNPRGTAHAAALGCSGTAAVFFLAVPHPGDRPSSEPAASCDPRLAAAILRTGLELAHLRSSFTLGDEVIGAHHYQTVYHFLWDQTEERLGLGAFLGFTIDLDYLRTQYFPAMVNREAAAAVQRKRRFALPLLALSIVDDTKSEVYRSGRSLASEYDAEAQFPLLFFDTELLESLGPLRADIRYWTVRAGYADANADLFVDRQMRQQQALWAVIALVALAGIGFIVRASIREARVSDLKADFMASVSHELKTPLAKIQLFAETLESGRTRTPEKAQEYYSIIRAQAMKLAYLIGMMLDFAKIEAGVRQYELEEISLQPVVQSALASFHEELALRSFSVETSFAPREIAIRGNTEGLQQLFANLISNAIKFAGDSRYVFVGVKADARDAIVEVADRGVGIPRTEQHRIFRKFYRVASATARPRVAGSGVGLAIVAHIARVHGGTVSVDSAPGRGAIFTVRIPLLETDYAAS